MKHNPTTHIGFGMLLGIGIAIALMFPFIPNISNSSVEIFTPDKGVFFSYYGAVFGGLIGGMFTYLGVRMSLDDRKYLEKKKSKENRDMLLVQLHYSYNQLSNYPDNDMIADGHKAGYNMIPKLITDDNWNEYLINIEGLSRVDNIYIREWFKNLQELDEKRASKSGITQIDLERLTPKQLVDRIKSIIDKLESETSC